MLFLQSSKSRKTHHRGATQGAKDMMNVNNKNTIKQMIDTAQHTQAEQQSFDVKYSPSPQRKAKTITITC